MGYVENYEEEDDNGRKKKPIGPDLSDLRNDELYTSKTNDKDEDYNIEEAFENAEHELKMEKRKEQLLRKKRREKKRNQALKIGNKILFHPKNNRFGLGFKNNNNNNNSSRSSSASHSRRNNRQITTTRKIDENGAGISIRRNATFDSDDEDEIYDKPTKMDRSKYSFYVGGGDETEPRDNLYLGFANESNDDDDRNGNVRNIRTNEHKKTYRKPWQRSNKNRNNNNNNNDNEDDNIAVCKSDGKPALPGFILDTSVKSQIYDSFSEKQEYNRNNRNNKNNKKNNFLNMELVYFPPPFIPRDFDETHRFNEDKYQPLDNNNNNDNNTNDNRFKTMTVDERREQLGGRELYVVDRKPMNVIQANEIYKNNREEKGKEREREREREGEGGEEKQNASELA